MSTPKERKLNLFSSRLKTLRGERTKAEFSREIGVSPPLYHQWENGATPTFDKAVLIATKCGVSVEWLLTGVENTAGNRLSASYALRQLENANAGGPACQNCDNMAKQINELRAELREARGVIRDMSASLAALTSMPKGVK